MLADPRALSVDSETSGGVWMSESQGTQLHLASTMPFFTQTETPHSRLHSHPLSSAFELPSPPNGGGGWADAD